MDEKDSIFKENNGTAINHINSVQKYNDLLLKQNELKKEADNLLADKKYEDAEKIYNEILVNIGKMPNDTGELSLSQIQMNELLTLLKNVYSNLSLTLAKQFNYRKAIDTASYLISNFDVYNEKSYLRILKWLIELGELEKAAEFQKEILRVFKNNVSIFEKEFSILSIKLKQKEKETLKVKETPCKSIFSFLNNKFLIGTIGLGVSILLFGVGWKIYKSKNISKYIISRK